MIQPKILQEDDDIIICYKPAGIATQTGRLGQQDMESLLRNYRAAKGENTYIGIVHRLDQPVEGLMVFAKNKKSSANLSSQVQKREIGKHYLAVAYMPEMSPGNETGIPLSGTLTDYLFFDRKENRTTVIPDNETGQAAAAQKLQKAVLDYEIKEQKDGVALFDITLHTGRHHQIRAQLAHLGCPIVGDMKYGAGQQEKKTGLALCAYRLEFVHPSTGKCIDLSIEPENPAFCAFVE